METKKIKETYIPLTLTYLDSIILPSYNGLIRFEKSPEKIIEDWAVYTMEECGIVRAEDILLSWMKKSDITKYLALTAKRNKWSVCSLNEKEDGVKDRYYTQQVGSITGKLKQPERLPIEKIKIEIDPKNICYGDIARVIGVLPEEMRTEDSLETFLSSRGVNVNGSINLGNCIKRFNKENEWHYKNPKGMMMPIYN